MSEKIPPKEIENTLEKNTEKPPTNNFQYGFVVIFYAFVLGVIIALMAGNYELSFKFLAKFWHDSNSLLPDLPSWVLYGLGPFLACPFLYFILSRIPEKRQHNPADIITGIHVYNGQIDAKSSLYSALASVFSIGFGFSVGYYAPTVQLGAGAGFILHRFRWFSPAYLYISIGAGAAAAIAAIFHSPIGAVVFVHEVLLRFFSIRAFAPITIAAVTSYIVSSKFFDKVIVFKVPPHYLADTSTYLAAAVAGVLAAVVGVGMIKSILKLQQFNQKRQHGLFKQLLMAAFLTSIIIMLIPQSAGSSLQSLQEIISGDIALLSLLLFIFLAKLCATTIAFGFGVPGGIFGPTIFIGATLGALVGNISELFYPDLIDSQQILIITTMAAMISAVLGAPIAMILIIIEITGDFQIISVVMLAVVMANITAYRFMGTSSFFDIQLKSRGFDFEAGRDCVYTEQINIHHLVEDDYIALGIDTPLEEAEKLMLDKHQNIVFVTDNDGNLLGQAKLVDIEFYQREMSEDGEPKTLSKVTQTNIPMIYQATSLWQAMQIMTTANTNLLPVIDGENNRQLLGVIHNNDLVKEYFTYMRRLRTQENATR